MQSQRKTGGRPAARPPTTTTATWFHLVSVIYTMMTASAAHWNDKSGGKIEANLIQFF